MTQEEIIKLAHAAGFNWPDIQATTIEQRLERFAALVAAAERKACVEACKEQRLLLGEDEAKYASLGIAMCVDAIKTRGGK